MTLKYLDLKRCVFPEVSIDEYRSKAGNINEVIVIGFKCIEEDVAEDIDDFLEKSFLNILDVDVAPCPDDDGQYVVFVEVKRDNEFFKMFSSIIEELENLTGKNEWVVTTRHNETAFPYNDIVALKKNVDIEGKYLPKEEEVEKKKKKTKESVSKKEILSFLQESNLSPSFQDGKLCLQGSRGKMYFEVVDFDTVDTISEHCKNKSMMLKEDCDTIFLKAPLNPGWSVFRFQDLFTIECEKSDKVLLVRY